MIGTAEHLDIFRKPDSDNLLLILAILLATWFIASVIRWVLRSLAENAPVRMRLRVLRLIPLLRLATGLTGAALIVPLVIEPSFRNVVALVASISISIAIAFVLKDYASSLAAGLVTVLENTYQPGDWVEIDGVYGEVKQIGVRAVHLMTAEDNEVIVPHYRFWSKPVSNSTSGSRSLLCVANFYLHPDHDGKLVMDCLEAVGKQSALRKPESKLSVTASEKPWGTHYKLKAYVRESREQFKFITELTVDGKAALRANAIQFAQATPVPIQSGKKK